MSMEKLNELVKVNLEEFAHFLSRAKPDDYYGLKFRIQTIEIIKKNLDNVVAKQQQQQSGDCSINLQDYKRTCALFDKQLSYAREMAERFERVLEKRHHADSVESIDFQEEEAACAMPNVFDMVNDFDRYWESCREEANESLEDCEDKMLQELHKIKLQRDETAPSTSSKAGGDDDGAGGK